MVEQLGNWCECTINNLQVYSNSRANATAGSGGAIIVGTGVLSYRIKFTFSGNISNCAEEQLIAGTTATLTNANLVSIILVFRQQTSSARKWWCFHITSRNRAAWWNCSQQCSCCRRWYYGMELNNDDGAPRQIRVCEAKDSRCELIM
jgi:hypothetical protein